MYCGSDTAPHPQHISDCCFVCVRCCISLVSTVFLSISQSGECLCVLPLCITSTWELPLFEAPSNREPFRVAWKIRRTPTEVHLLYTPPPSQSAHTSPRRIFMYYSVPAAVSRGFKPRSPICGNLHLTPSPSTLPHHPPAQYALSSCGDFYAGVGGPGRLPPHQYHNGVGGGWTSVNFRPERVALGWRR